MVRAGNKIQIYGFSAHFIHLLINPTATSLPSIAYSKILGCNPTVPSYTRVNEKLMHRLTGPLTLVTSKSLRAQSYTSSHHSMGEGCRDLYLGKGTSLHGAGGGIFRYALG